ncbi:MAG TPA: heavy metal-associated domain-containing protein [Bryobacteraceae bacterium]|nr:heavy metal-associated domain-containing protein [Bryobacteraceae bacterium]
MPVQTLNMAVLGMTCANCARGVERALTATPGVTKAAVDLEGAKAAVEYDPGKTNPETLAAAVRKLGYDARP